MPILDIQMVGPLKGTTPGAVTRAIANDAAALFGAGPKDTWVKLSSVARDHYAENAGGPDAFVLPVFVSVLRYQRPASDEAAIEAPKLARVVAAAKTAGKKAASVARHLR